MKHLRPFVYSLAGSVGFLLFLVWIAMQGQLTLASFLNGDTKWMAAQSNAITDLLAYAQAGHPADYANFRRHVATIEAYRVARDEVLSGDSRSARATFAQANIYVAKMGNVLFVFSHFAGAPYLKEAVRLWKSTDVLVAGLSEVGNELHRSYLLGRPSGVDQIAQVAQIQALGDRALSASSKFSQVIITGAVVASYALFGMIFLVAALAITLWFVIAHRVVRRIHEDQELLEHLALHDSLTGLINRVEFESLCEARTKLASRNAKFVAVLFLDLDGFKAVNDRYGHGFGDGVLKLVGERIMGQLRNTDAASRLGGDEFAVLLTGIHRREDAAAFAKRISEALAQPFAIEGHDIVIGSSIGIAVSDTDGKAAGALIANADAAMYAAKKNKPDAWRFYDASMEGASQAHGGLTADLRAALQREEFRLAYQPIVDMHSGRIVSAEALLRWDHPSRGEVLPDEFISSAHGAGLLPCIDNWVIHTACVQIRAWDKANVPPVRVAVNVSVDRFCQEDFVAFVHDALRAASVPAQRLVLEITERAILQLSSTAARTVRALEALGIGVAIDDCGPADTSAPPLRLPGVAFVKLERPLVAGLSSAGGDGGLAGAALATARHLSATVIAEGVESIRQRHRLLDAGCTNAQGFLYSVAMPPAALEAMLRAQCEPTPAERSAALGAWGADW